MSQPQEPERVQKVLSRLGVASRREAEQWIRAGRLTINGHAAGLGDRVAGGDQLRLDGRLIRQPPLKAMPVLLCHRSPGVPLLAVPGGAEPLSARIPARLGRRFTSVSPMPQIDGGLELLSADGGLASKLQRAVRTQTVEFSLRIRGALSEAQRAGILSGVLDRGTLSIQSVEGAGGEASNRWYQLVARGVSGNDLRQLLERLGVSASRLLRTRLGSLQLERALARGRWRELTADELDALLSPAASAASATVPIATASEPGD